MEDIHKKENGGDIINLETQSFCDLVHWQDIGGGHCSESNDCHRVDCSLEKSVPPLGTHLVDFILDFAPCDLAMTLTFGNLFGLRQTKLFPPKLFCYFS